MSTSSTIQSGLKIFAKIWLAVTSVVGSLLVVAMIALIVVGTSGVAAAEETHYPTKTIESGGKEKVAVVYLSGEIVSDDLPSSPLSFSDGIISSKKIVALLKHIEDDNDIKSVVLNVNSPGGGVVASDDIYQQVVKLKQKKPVVVHFGDVSASGGYYISAGASEIIANPATITGSIGVIAQFPQYSGLMEKIGVEMRTFKSGEFKDIGSPERPVTDTERVIIQGMITDSYDQFVQSIVEGRKMDESRVRQLADGRIYTGKQAKENGLVDDLGGLDKAIDRAKTLSNVSNATVIEFTDGGFFESLFSSTMKQLNPVAKLSSSIPSSHSGLYYLMSF